MNRVALTVRNAVAAAISKDRLELPTLPKVALNIRDATQQEDISAAALARVISADPGLSARVVKVANSPSHRGTREVESIHSAVSRLGIEYCSNLATSLAMQGMFQATSEIIDRKMHDAWSHATEVAAISSVLTKNFTDLKPDLAMLAGLTHNIGMLPVLSWAEEHSNLLNNSLLLDDVIDNIHGDLGVLILRSWDFPREIHTVPLDYMNFERESDCADYIDVVQVANLQAYAGSKHPCSQINWSDVHAFRQLGLDPSVEAKEIEDISEDLEATMELLS